MYQLFVVVVDFFFICWNPEEVSFNASKGMHELSSEIEDNQAKSKGFFLPCPLCRLLTEDVAQI